MEYKYPVMPKKIMELRINQNNVGTPLICSNLYSLKFTNLNYKLALFSVEILPEIANDNFTLMRQIHYHIEPLLPKNFKKCFYSGNNLYAIIDDNINSNYEKIEINEEIDKIKYIIKIKKISSFTFKDVTDFDGDNQKIKHIFENLIKNILLRNPNVIKFSDRTIFEISKNNISNVNAQGDGNIYHGYITSAHITENGLYMLINNVNKYISGKTDLTKMKEI
jgi:hypothetical protein